MSISVLDQIFTDLRLDHERRLRRIDNIGLAIYALLILSIYMCING